MAAEFTLLEKNILKAKGLTDEQLTALTGLGIGSRADFAEVGNVVTLLELLPDLNPDVATRLMEWALPHAAATAAAPGPGSTAVAPAAPIIVDSSDVVFCAHCKAKQPKDYSPGDLCVNCGRQAEPIEQCFWCGNSGPGRFCRACGATFVRTSELPLAMLLRRDGLAKDEIPKRLSEMSADDKEQLWGRVRRARQ